ncbi:MAG TPA: S24 family peptidase [Candidatus Acidoferrales bacterium]|nr:S24 family peptidase [Candidatus Acidoferrales bacterium]
MGTQDKFGDTLSELIAPGLFQDAQKARYPAENGSAVIAAALNLKGRAFLRVSAKSMLPWFRPGDVVFARKTDASQISRGNVVVFDNNGHLSMHRVIERISSANEDASSARFITKGDSRVLADAPIGAVEICGRVEFLYRNGNEIRLASGWRKVFGKFLAAISRASRFWLPRYFEPQGSADDVVPAGWNLHETIHSGDSHSS